jgi:hypothetical protein
MYTALAATSLTVAELLRTAFASDAILGGLFGGGTMVVSLNSPRELSNLSQQGLSVWLYRVERDTERLNAPPERISYNQLRRPPLPLRLHYLMTPIVSVSLANSPETEQIILGKTLQVLNDHPIMRGADLQSSFGGTNIELQARLEPLGLDELARVYDALERSFQLSVSYEISVVLIDAALQPEAVAPVQEVIPEYGLIVG